MLSVRWSSLALLALTGVGCDTGAKPSRDAGSQVAPTARAPAAPRDAAPPLARPGPSSDVSDGGAPGARDDAGRAATEDAGAPLSLCRIAYGPAELPFWGAATLVTSPTSLRVVTNDGGKPRVHEVPLAAPPPAGAPPVSPARALSFEAMRGPPCEVAGKWAYCPGPGGLVQRSVLGGADTKTVAKSRPGTRVAAASFGGDHAIVAYLDTRKTTEGDTVQAFVALDEQEPVRLSEDGAGATSVRLLARGGGIRRGLHGRALRDAPSPRSPARAPRRQALARERRGRLRRRPAGARRGLHARRRRPRPLRARADAEGDGHVRSGRRAD